MRINEVDVSAYVGPKHHHESAHPMYSFDVPAYRFWHGFYHGLIDAGRSHDEALQIMQSKDVRFMFDGDSSDALESLGKLYSHQCCKR